MKSLSQHINESLQVVNEAVFDFANQGNGSLAGFKYYDLFEKILKKSAKAFTKNTIKLNATDSIIIGKPMAAGKKVVAGTVMIYKSSGGTSFDVVVAIDEDNGLENFDRKVRTDSQFFRIQDNLKDIEKFESNYKKFSEFNFAYLFEPTESTLELVMKYKGKVKSYDQIVKDYNLKIGFKHVSN